MKATDKIIGRLIVGCVLACCLTPNIHAKSVISVMPPIPPPHIGIVPHTARVQQMSDNGLTPPGSGDTNAYYPYSPDFNPTPVITYPTNITLKWYLAMDAGAPMLASLTLAPDGTLYSVNQEVLSAIDTTAVNTNDVNYPSQDDFTKWFAFEKIWYDNGSTPAVGTDGTVYASLDKELYFAINPTNGEVLWEFYAGGNVGSQPAVGVDGTVYIGGEHYVATSNPTVSASYFYALTNAFGVTNFYSNTNLYSRLLTNVGIKWIFIITNDAQLFSVAAPAIGRDGTIYVNEMVSNGYNSSGDSGQVLYALNPTNGTLLWHTSPLSGMSPGIGNGATGPAIGPDGTIYYGIGTNFIAIDPKAPVTNGVMSFKWIYSNVGLTFAWRPVVGSDGTIYVEANSSTYAYSSYPIAFIATNQLFAFEPTSGVPKWTNNLSPINYWGAFWKGGSLAIASDGEIILADADGTLYSFAPNGQTNWTYQTGAQALNSPLIGPDGTIYVETIYADAGCYVYAFAGTSPISCGSWPEDGRNARRTATVVTASVMSPKMTTNGFQFTMIGPTNMPVCPCASSDFTTWTNIGQTILTGGSTNFVDIGVSNYPYRFYEAKPQ